MHETVVLDLPEQVTQRARQIAVFTQRQLEDVLLDWLVQSAVELPVEMLADDQGG